nr:choice-of-anchor K domain-containing protein [Opitutus terrae]
MFAAALGLALTCSLAHAQLLLSGYTTGSFVDLSEPNTTVSNAGDGSWATFHTGIAATGSTQSKIEFSNTTFTDVASGDPIQVGLFEITNGMTLIGSGAPTAQFNLGLELTSPVMQSVALTQITFHVDHTPNLPGAIPDTFSASFTQPTAMKIGDYLVQFHVNFDPAEFQVAENTMVQRGDITVSFTPVPEPATYAAWGAALLVGLVGYRRLRARSAASLPAAA